MEPPKAISQDEVFYTGVWTRRVEYMAFHNLHWEWKQGYGREACIYRAKRATDDLGPNIPMEEWRRKLGEWEQRYNNFKGLTERQDVRFTWNGIIAKVEASADVWHRIARENPQLLCYLDEGEKNWSCLRLIFTQWTPPVPSPERSIDEEFEALMMPSSDEEGMNYSD